MDVPERKTRILVVEDESIVALDMRGRLDSMGYDVVGLASTGEEAVAISASASPDLILMDIKLKGELDGVQAAELIRSNQDIPIIFITAFADSRTLLRAKVTQAFGYILKPFQEREVLISMEMALYKHRMERELRESRDRLDGTLNAISDAVIGLDEERRIVSLNSAAETMIGMDEATAKGRSFDSVCSFTESEALQALGLAHRENAGGRDVSWVLVSTLKGRFPVERILTDIPRRHPETGSGRVFVLRDISELVIGEKIRSRLAAIVSNSHDAILSVSRNLRIVSWNLGAELMYGYVPGEVIGRSLLELVPDEEGREKLRDYAELVFGGTEVGRFDAHRLCRSGKIVPVSSSLSSVSDAGGGVMELSCIERDISAEKQYEASLVQAKLAAEEATRAKGEFLSNMSHELRTPLNSILGMVELSRDMASSDEQAEYLEIVRQSADSLLFLINSILDYSKIEAGKMHIHEIPFDPVAAVANCIDRLAVQAHRKGLSLVFRFDAACPSQVIGDSFRFLQILTNLLSNAIKFTERGRVRVDLCVFRSSGSSVAMDLIVSDTGIGIPEDKLQVIWNEFTQVDGSSTRAYGGTGLGLAIVRSLAELMGGAISVESEIDRGSVFKARFPFSLIEGIPCAVVSQPALVGEAVAIVSPVEEEREIIAELVRAWGLRPLVYTDANTFLVSFRTVPLPRVALVDERLASSLAQELGSMKSGAVEDALRDRLVALSSIGLRAEAVWHSISPSIRFLMKPVRADALLDILHGVARSAGAERSSASEGLPKSRNALKGSGTGALPLRVFASIREGQAADAVKRFIVEADSLGRDFLPSLETSALACKKEMDASGETQASRLLFKVVLAYRRDDYEAAALTIDTLRTMIDAEDNELIKTTGGRT
ncbi:MAG: hypothetical protein A2Z99_05420 [Treponema sp. GWB1_62_6]|nr:MAG: hypothetical protein A2001_12580 [Treponema sp. GWC1_61_84]OHE70751.1 MAG: hypothetical protein A2Z99_05420 [Treponema sp. GWB1_62_6]OHE76734.1 MAG: hypothetical protein A2413_18715 [Treponema sp. RIFOXYC1_FULL_61_9]HCM26273.1 hypothetical protein [Treponema sp.]